MAEGAVPEAVSLSHAALSLAVQLSVPVPVFVTFTIWFTGLAPPWGAEKVRLVGERPIAGGLGALTMVVIAWPLVRGWILPERKS